MPTSNPVVLIELRALIAGGADLDNPAVRRLVLRATSKIPDRIQRRALADQLMNDIMVVSLAPSIDANEDAARREALETLATIEAYVARCR